jgi:hypothetical protein
MQSEPVSSLVYEVCMHLRRPRAQEHVVKILLPDRWLAAQENWDLGSRSRSRPAGDERRPGCKSFFFEPTKTLTRPLSRARCSPKRFFNVLVGLQTERVEKHYKYKRFVATKQICVQSHDISALDTLTNVSSASGGSGYATSGSWHHIYAIRGKV